jgi:RNA polymerase primary sigma factor
MQDDLDIVNENDILVIETIVYNDNSSYAEDNSSPSLKTYIRQLSKFPLLTREQELSLTRNLKKNREILYSAFMKTPECRLELMQMLNAKVGRARRMFDHIAEATDDDEKVLNLQEELANAIKDNNFSKKNHKNFQNLVIPFNDFYRLVNILKAKELTPEVSKALNEYNQMKKRLSECNLRLVFARAKRFMNRGMSLEDLIQEGNVGLLKAIEKYNPEKGNKFSTYATWWIDQAFGRALVDKSKLVRIPVHMVDSINKVNKAFQTLSETLTHEPSNEEIAKLTGLTLEKVRKVRNSIILKAKYLQEFQNDKALPKIMDFPDESKNPEEQLEEKELSVKVREFLATLSPQEEKILRLRFGIGEARSYEVQEIANTVKLTRQRVSQILNKTKKLWEFKV